MVVTPCVSRRQRAPVVVLWLGSDELLPRWPRERLHCALEALLRQLLRLAGTRAEPGAPQQALGLCGAEAALVDGHPRGRRAPPPALAAALSPLRGKRLQL